MKGINARLYETSISLCRTPRDVEVCDVRSHQGLNSDSGVAEALWNIVRWHNVILHRIWTRIIFHLHMLVKHVGFVLFYTYASKYLCLHEYIDVQSH